MARRKRQFLDDGDSDSASGSEDDGDFGHNENPDERDARELFENPYQRKRQRRDGKEDAIYGVFGDDSEEEGFNRNKGGRKQQAARSDFTKAPAFVSGNKGEPSRPVDVDQALDAALKANEDVNGQDEDDTEEQEDEEDDDDESEDSEALGDESPAEAASRPASPRVREPSEEAEERPRLGGIGIGAGKSSGFGKAGIGAGAAKSSTSFGGFSKSDIASSNPPSFGLSGFSKAGIGASNPVSISSSTPPPSSAPPPAPKPATVSDAAAKGDFDRDSDLPASFGGAKSRAQRAFVRDSTPSSRGSHTPAPMSATEQAHFAKISGSYGARMLAKMGWQSGSGLGTTGEGIVTPVETKLRPKNQGIAYKGFSERTDQSKAEARRRGEKVSDEEDEKRKKAKGPRKVKEQTQKSDAWKKPKKVRTKVEHKTYDEILAEAGEPAPSGVGVIIDATGATPREVSSIADVSMSSWTPSTDPMRIPEVRHNLRLIVDASKTDLEALAQEARALHQRKNFATTEEMRLATKVKNEAELIKRLQQVHLIADDISAQTKQLASVYEPSLDVFTASFEKLSVHFPQECERYRLDEVVVAAIAPTFKRMLTTWKPLEEPDLFVTTLRQWRGLLRINTVEEPPQNQVGFYNSHRSAAAVAPAIEKSMTPFESLMWNAWLPKIRSAVNNDWSPSQPSPLVAVYEAWSDLLPPFVRDNLFDQLVLPKIHKAVSDWNPRQAKTSLQTLVFPWLPHVGLRVEELLGDARRKIKSILRAWTVEDNTPQDLSVWKEVFDKGEWDTIMLKHVLPKLSAYLRSDFTVNPRSQSMQPIQRILLWSDLLRPSLFSPLLEQHFFPKWLDVLHFWLVQPSPSFEEIAQWYQFWKATFPEKVQNMPAVAQGFNKGLQLMNQAIELGADAPTRLPRPNHSRSSTPVQQQQQTASKATAKTSARTHEITFRSMVEEYAAAHNLMIIAAGRVHETSRLPLFRVSQRADGKGGLLVYIEDDAVWAPDGDDYRAISLEDMVLRATKAS